ncbi:glucose-1-phosphatase [Phycisphaerales bacterium]|nr:glucose-1-phosphatase [Phycisphaerales bacterium]
MPTPIRLICFDLGGVIIKHHRSWAEACAATGTPYHDAVAAPELVQRRRDLAKLHHTGKIACNDFFPALAAATNHLYSESQVRLLHNAWVYAEYEGIDALLQRLVSANRADTAILSNTNATHWSRLGRGQRDGLPLFSAPLRLNNRHASHILGLAKPDPAIYRVFEAQVGFRGAEILFFDDLAENIAAARQLGWRCQLIDHTKNTAEQVELALNSHHLLSEP